MSNQTSRGIPTQQLIAVQPRGLGPGSAGQSGDNQGLSQVGGADSESVEELIEEGQFFEAEAVSGIENASGGNAEVRTRQFPEDDVPKEYQESES